MPSKEGSQLHFRQEIGASLTLQFAEAANERRAQGQPILSLGLGEPDFETPAAIIEAVHKVLSQGNSRYSGALGVAPLRELIADKLKADNNVSCPASSIMVTAGAKQALSTVLMAMLEPEDEVIVVSPCFVSFIPQIYLAEPSAKVHTVYVDKTSHALPLDAIEATINSKTRAILINSPNNPAGYVSSDSELKKLYELAASKNIYLISDEVYEKLVLGDARHTSPGSFEASPKHVVTINGFSKSHALTGWRVGYCTLPDAIKGRAIKIQQHMNTNTCTFIQQALAESWDPELAFLDDYRHKLESRLELIATWLQGNVQLKAALPKAGFFVFVDSSALGMNSNEFCAGLLRQTGVATTPGLAFGSDWDDHFRLSFAVPDEVLAEALEKITAFAQSQSA
ncbi:MAG: pyridoxal phosphate-dependent aminotransferase [Granulosicoccus sp.]